MLRGTRLIEGKEASEYVALTSSLRNTMLKNGFEEIIVPSIWESSTFIGKVGNENENMMWTFKDKGDRDVCLIPEVTGIFQEIWKNDWSKKMSKRNIFYVQRCYRYERPQAGRYREFTQFGIEMLGEKNSLFARELLRNIIYNNFLPEEAMFNESVKRGLNYYVEDGFEVSCPILGAQKQIAGGGSYSEGVGWAIGVDRMLLALTEITKARMV